jgi:hypothetical protein
MRTPLNADGAYSVTVSTLEKQAADTTAFIGDKSQSQFFTRVRRALMFSVLSTMMQNFNAVYSPLDIVTGALTVYFVCVALRVVVAEQWGVCTSYIMHSLSRQSVLVVSDVIVNNIRMRDVGTQQENTLLLVVSTTALIALLTLLPDWFLQDTDQGSLRDLLIYSFTCRYSQLHIPGLQTSPGARDAGVAILVYGLLFAVFTQLNVSSEGSTRSRLRETLYQTAAMILSNMFLTQIVPDSSSQVIPVAVLLGMYIVSDHLPMSSTVASFVLWRTASETSAWVSQLLPGSTTDQTILFAVVLCVVPALDRKVGSVLAVAALQTGVAHTMRMFAYFGSIGGCVASVCVVLVIDVVLDGMHQSLKM